MTTEPAAAGTAEPAAFFAGQGGAGFALGPVEILAKGSEAPALSGLRAAMERRVLQLLPGDVGAVTAALLTGGQSGISAEAMGWMRDSGLAHLLSVSALHIGIMMGMAFFLIRAGLALWPGFALRFGTKPAAVGGLYRLLTGAEVPMLRSFAMAAVVTLAILAGRRALTQRVLALAAVAVLLLHPAAILGHSFQMSFAAVMALIAAAEAARSRRLPGPRSWWRRALLVLGGSLVASLVAGATTPFGLNHFGRLQLHGVAANAVAVPLTTFLVMPAGLASVVLMPLGLNAVPLRVMGWGVGQVLAVVRMVASWPAASVLAVPIPGWGLAATAMGCACGGRDGAGSVRR